MGKKWWAHWEVKRPRAWVRTMQVVICIHTIGVGHRICQELGPKERQTVASVVKECLGAAVWSFMRSYLCHWSRFRFFFLDSGIIDLLLGYGSQILPWRLQAKFLPISYLFTRVKLNIHWATTPWTGLVTFFWRDKATLWLCLLQTGSLYLQDHNGP